MILLWLLAIFGLLVLFSCAFFTFQFVWGMLAAYNDYGKNRGQNINYSDGRTNYSGLRKKTPSQENT